MNGERWDIGTLCAAALAARLQEAMAERRAWRRSHWRFGAWQGKRLCRVVAGWVGADRWPEGDSAVMGIESLVAREEPQAARAVRWTDIGEGRALVVYQEGTLTLPLVGNVWVTESTGRGRTRRAEILGRARLAFSAVAGAAPGVAVVLANAARTRAMIALDETAPQDAPEGIARDEWRGVLRFTARMPVEVAKELPLAQAIRIAVEPDRLTRVSDIT